MSHPPPTLTATHSIPEAPPPKLRTAQTQAVLGDESAPGHTYVQPDVHAGECGPAAPPSGAAAHALDPPDTPSPLGTPRGPQGAPRAVLGRWGRSTDVPLHYATPPGPYLRGSPQSLNVAAAPLTLRLQQA